MLKNLHYSFRNFVPLPIFSHLDIDDIPKDECYYTKDTNNELLPYVGTWTGTWDNKTIYITFKKVEKRYNDFFKYYKDLLIAKFKVVNSDGSILFDNSNLIDYNAKIFGGGFMKLEPQKYLLSYVDRDLCNVGGGIEISFTDASQNQLKWKYSQDFMTVFPSCQYYNAPVFPQALPKSIVLTKQ